MMKLAVDTQYADGAAVTAGVIFREWTDATPVRTYGWPFRGRAGDGPGVIDGRSQGVCDRSAYRDELGSGRGPRVAYGGRVKIETRGRHAVWG